MRSLPLFNYYVLGPKGFGPFTFPVDTDSCAEMDFARWVAGEPDVVMAYGPRHPGRYTLWRQPIPTSLLPSQEFVAAWEKQDEDQLVASETLGPRYTVRPDYHYRDYFFGGQITSHHSETEAVEDIWLVDPLRADRVLVLGVYGEPEEIRKGRRKTGEYTNPTWMTWLSTTIPVYAPGGGGVLAEVVHLVGRDRMRDTDVTH